MTHNYVRHSLVNKVQLCSLITVYHIGYGHVRINPLSDRSVALRSVNPLPTNDAPMRHDLCELSISIWGV